MTERVLLVHGWSVQETTTYQALHRKLADHGYELRNVCLGRYVSLDDKVEIRDLARGMDRAIREELGESPWSGPIHVITHSTGALVVRQWIVDHYREERTKGHPIKNVVFLAGPHFGSRLAHHGRSMLAAAYYWGDTGDAILGALELGSPFCWDNNSAWLDHAQWQKKGIRPYCLIGDRTTEDFFKSRVFPAGYEEGSDMVVRVPSGNLNFRRFRLDAATQRFERVGEIAGVPFVALGRYVHSGPDNGIMNSITKRAEPERERWQNLRLILRCLGVRNTAQYSAVRDEFAALTQQHHRERANKNKPGPFAQLVFRFHGDDGQPINDYRVTLGYLHKDRDRGSKTVAHVHKNEAAPQYFTAFINTDRIDRRFKYFFELRADTGTPLTGFDPQEFRIELSRSELDEIIVPDQTTQIDVVLRRRSEPELFRFHRGDDDNLHVKWDREGKVSERNRKTK